MLEVPQARGGGLEGGEGAGEARESEVAQAEEGEEVGGANRCEAEGEVEVRVVKGEGEGGGRLVGEVSGGGAEES